MKYVYAPLVRPRRIQLCLSKTHSLSDQDTLNSHATHLLQPLHVAHQSIHAVIKKSMIKGLKQSIK